MIIKHISKMLNYAREYYSKALLECQNITKKYNDDKFINNFVFDPTDWRNKYDKVSNKQERIEFNRNKEIKNLFKRVQEYETSDRTEHKKYFTNEWDDTPFVHTKKIHLKDIYDSTRLFIKLSKYKASRYDINHVNDKTQNEKIESLMFKSQLEQMYLNQMYNINCSVDSINNNNKNASNESDINGTRAKTTQNGDNDNQDSKVKGSGILLQPLFDYVNKSLRMVAPVRGRYQSYQRWDMFTDDKICDLELEILRNYQESLHKQYDISSREFNFIKFEKVSESSTRGRWNSSRVNIEPYFVALACTYDELKFVLSSMDRNYKDIIDCIVDYLPKVCFAIIKRKIRHWKNDAGDNWAYESSGSGESIDVNWIYLLMEIDESKLEYSFQKNETILSKHYFDNICDSKLIDLKSKHGWSMSQHLKLFPFLKSLFEGSYSNYY